MRVGGSWNDHIWPFTGEGCQNFQNGPQSETIYVLLFISLQGESCCNYGSDGKKVDGVYDCIIIPGAEKAATPMDALGKGFCQGGGGGGIATVSGKTGTTVCSKYLSIGSWSASAKTFLIHTHHLYIIRTL